MVIPERRHLHRWDRAVARELLRAHFFLCGRLQGGVALQGGHIGSASFHEGDGNSIEAFLEVVVTGRLRDRRDDMRVDGIQVVPWGDGGMRRGSMSASVSPSRGRVRDRSTR